MTVKELIKILKKMPQDAIATADDGTGWLAKIEEDRIYEEECDDLHWVVIGTGDEGI